ncbi:hypothetical protein AAZX31_12G127600 [Glycine max]
MDSIMSKLRNLDAYLKSMSISTVACSSTMSSRLLPPFSCSSLLLQAPYDTSSSVIGITNSTSYYQYTQVIILFKINVIRIHISLLITFDTKYYIVKICISVSVGDNSFM